MGAAEPGRGGPDEPGFIDRPEPQGGRHEPLSRLGMLWFMASLGALFAGSVVAFVIVRSAQAEPAGLTLPLLLWPATLVLVVQGVVLERAARRTAEAYRPTPELRLALALGGLFLLLQLLSWFELDLGDLPPARAALQGFTFAMLTALHGLHVVGGLLSLGWVLRRARAGAYDGGRGETLRNVATYWHFLLGVWILLFAVLGLVA
ncbi:MAG: cytochrome c oxidase subunit 3 [Planctomycetota bacterium]